MLCFPKTLFVILQLSWRFRNTKPRSPSAFSIWDDCFVAFRLHKGLGFQSSTNSVKPEHRSSPSGEDWDGNGSKVGLKTDPLYLKSSVKPWQWNKRKVWVYPSLEERLRLQQLDLDWTLLWAWAKTCFCFHLLFHLLPMWKKFHTAVGINRNDPKGRRQEKITYGTGKIFSLSFSWKNYWNGCLRSLNPQIFASSPSPQRAHTQMTAALFVPGCLMDFAVKHTRRDSTWAFRNPV